MCYAVRLCAGELVVADPAGDVQRLNTSGRRLSDARRFVQVLVAASLWCDAGVDPDLGTALLPLIVSPKRMVTQSLELSLLLPPSLNMTK